KLPKTPNVRLKKMIRISNKNLITLKLNKINIRNIKIKNNINIIKLNIIIIKNKIIKNNINIII
ncbi:hypothetical protein ABTE52_21725, partial [Acinetobacter baumannii]